VDSRLLAHAFISEDLRIDPYEENFPAGDDTSKGELIVGRTRKSYMARVLATAEKCDPAANRWRISANADSAQSSGNRSG
jgi:hypothetical protein